MEKKIERAVEKSKQRISESKDLIEKSRAIIGGEPRPLKAKKKTGRPDTP
jgi:hypothetical protein